MYSMIVIYFQLLDWTDFIFLCLLEHVIIIKKIIIFIMKLTSLKL